MVQVVIPLEEEGVGGNAVDDSASACVLVIDIVVSGLVSYRDQMLRDPAHIF